MKHYLPTHDEIAAECARIREGWSPETELLRGRGLTRGEPGGRDEPRGEVIHQMHISRERMYSVIHGTDHAV